MLIEKKLILLFFISFCLFFAVHPVLATHISKPVLIESKTEYTQGETIHFNGWADYNEQPTAGVLIHFSVLHEDGSAISEQFQETDAQGHFEFTWHTEKMTAGTYTITITSHCKEIHRSICSYNSKTQNIHLK